jgi:aspartyl/asparaginyl beta-hydroxylase (cupin superfamily)
MPSAQAYFHRQTAADGSDPRQWVNLALACQALKDEAGEERAIARALSVDPRDLLALLLRGALLERQGKTHEAARAFGAAANMSPPMDRLVPELRPSVAHAIQFREQYDKECGEFIDRHLEGLYCNHAGEDLRRFRDSVDLMVGRKRRFDSQPALYFYPRLVPIEFFERAEFPWLDVVEGATDQIRDEFLEVLRTEEGFEPYITYPPDVPHNQWAELNNSPRWSALHLYKSGERVDSNAARCPRTMQILDSVPQPRQARRTPTAMFSLLKPRTRIPPHTGVTNVRLVVHLPLIVPANCGFRVGNETRQWVPGKAWVFDDTLEHEAWNDSDKPRVVLIFDTWHPHLTPTERILVESLSEALNAFSGAPTGYDI